MFSGCTITQVSIDHVIGKVTLESNVHLASNQVYFIMYVIRKIMANSLYLKQYQTGACHVIVFDTCYVTFFSIFQGHVSKSVKMYSIHFC